MKKTAFLIIITFLIIRSGIAQVPNLGSSKGVGEKIIVSIYNDLWQGADSSITVSGFNPGFSSYFMYHIPFGQSKFSFNIGLGVGCHNLRSDASPAKEMNFDTAWHYTGNTVFERIPESMNNKKVEYDANKLSMTYFDVPCELKFSSENEKGKVIKIALGFKVGYMINGHTKYRGDDILTGSDDEIKYKSFKIPNIEPLRYGASARIGYGMFSIFGYYSLTTIFKTDKGPEVFPISAGITLSFL